MHFLKKFISDEEDDKNVLSYLPVTLEIDEPENVDGPLMAQNSQMLTTCDSGTPTKSPKRMKAIDIDLKDAPREGNLLVFFFSFYTVSYFIVTIIFTNLTDLVSKKFFNSPS